MFHNIKKFLKVLIILLLILLVGIICYRYKKLKEEGKINEIFASTNQNVVYINSTDPYETTKEDSSKGESSYEKKNYDDYYNEFNFDNVLLLYEGNQNGQTTIEALDRLIADADDSLYTKPSVVFQNFNVLSKNEISADNLEEYKKVLNEAKKSIKNNTYTFSFEYNKLNAIVNKIIITQNR